MFGADGKYLISGIVQRSLECAAQTLLRFEIGGHVHDPELALLYRLPQVVPSPQNNPAGGCHVY